MFAKFLLTTCPVFFTVYFSKI